MRRTRGALGGSFLTYKRRSIGQTGPATTEPLLLPVPVQQEQLPQIEPETLSSSADVATEPPVENDLDEEELSRHYQRKVEEVKQWCAIRLDIQQAAYETAAPVSTLCRVGQCTKHAVRRLLKCEDCGPQYVGCEECVVNDHKFRQMHTLEMWLGDRFQPYRPTCMPTFCRLEHVCGSTRARKITVINDKGCELDVLCEFCDCELPPVTLRRYGLWPATPNEPRSAYSVVFLRRAESLMVSAHVSLSAIIEANRYDNRQNRNEIRLRCTDAGGDSSTVWCTPAEVLAVRCRMYSGVAFSGELTHWV
jgi:hypothetical protein